jgi:GAF domain-containing protein
MAENLPDDHGLRALAQFFINDSTLGDTLLRVAELACKVIPAADMAGITLLVEGRPATGVFTDAQAPEIDAAQYANDSGPCLEAFRRQQVIRIDSAYTDPRWPEFTAAAIAHGIAATLSVPLAALGEGLGALNLYSRTGPFADQEVQQAEAFAMQASILLANVQVYWDARELGERLQQAMRSRATIEHAVGILLAGGGRTPEEAFQLLVRASQRENRKLRDIAAAIVDRAVEGNWSG